jgi:hypothetical protein
MQIFRRWNQLTPVKEILLKDAPLTILGGIGMIQPQIVNVTIASVLNRRSIRIAVV